MAGAAYSVLLARTLPLTYDEARNWLGFSQHGVHFVTHNYLVANNHVLYTALIALIPHSVVHDDPLNLRVLNIAVAIVLIDLMFVWLVREGVPWLLSIAALLLSGPITVIYLGVARGYLLGTLLAFLGIHLLAVRGHRLFDLEELEGLALHPPLSHFLRRFQPGDPCVYLGALWAP